MKIDIKNLMKKKELIAELTNKLKKTKLTVKEEVNNFLLNLKSSPI